MNELFIDSLCSWCEGFVSACWFQVKKTASSIRRCSFFMVKLRKTIRKELCYETQITRSFIVILDG